MHEWAERAVDAARRLGDARLIAAALAELALAELDDGRGRASRVQPCGGGGARRFPLGRRARRPPRGRRLARRRRALSRPLRRGRGSRRARADRRARDRPGRALPPPGGDPRRAPAPAGQAGRGRPSCSTAASRRPACSGTRTRSCWTLMGRSAAALRSGDVELALATAQESFDLSRHADSSFHSAEAAADLAAALLETGQPEPAVELLLESAGGEELALIAGSPRARYLEVLARCRLALDATRRGEADGRRRGCLGLGRAPADGSCLGRPDGGRRRAAHRRSRRAQPSGRSRRPRPPTTPARRSRPRCRARWRASRSAARATRDRAAAELQHAARAFERCGALRHRDEAERELRKLGHHIHRRTRPGAADGTGLESLTGRELQLARLVVDRKTNPQIAVGAVPQPEDGRDAPAQHLPQGRRLFARRARAGGRERGASAGTSRRAADAGPPRTARLEHDSRGRPRGVGSTEGREARPDPANGGRHEQHPRDRHRDPPVPRPDPGRRPGRPSPPHRSDALADEGARRRSLPGRAACGAPGARPLLGGGVRVRAGRREAERAAAVHDGDRRRRCPLHPCEVAARRRAAADHDARLARLRDRAARLRRAADRPDRLRRRRRRRVPPRAALPARLRLLRRADRARLGRRPHRPKPGRS